MKISKNGKVVGSLKISDLHAGHQDKAPGSDICSGAGNVVAAASRLPCGLTDLSSDPVDGSSQSCQLTLDLNSAKLPYKKSLNRLMLESGDGRLNSQVRQWKESDTPGETDPCLSSAAVAAAAKSPSVQQLRVKEGSAKQRPRKPPAPSKATKPALPSCQHLNHHPQQQQQQQQSDLNDAFNPKSSSNEPVIAGSLENCHATDVVQVETTTTLPVDTTSCLSNIRSNIFKTTLKNRKNPVQPGFRGDRIVPSSLGMVGTVVSVTKGGQFI